MATLVVYFLFMAQRRMFSPDIVGSDAFLDMPTSSQALYFHLGMYADDDGFVNPKRIMRMVGVQDDDLKVLISKRFVLPFENGVVVIKHWKINNLVRKDWYKETPYIEQKKTLYLKESGAYTDNPSHIKLVNETTPESLTVRPRRLGKVRLGKNTIQATETVADEKPKFSTMGAEIIKSFESVNPNCKRFYNNPPQRGACDRLIEQYGLERVLKVIAFLPKSNTLSYLPTITTPVQLEEKWVALESGVLKQRSKTISTGKGLA